MTALLIGFGLVLVIVTAGVLGNHNPGKHL